MVYSAFLSFNLIFGIVTVVLNYCFSIPQEANAFAGIPFQIMWAAALTSYMFKSGSVKRTFVNTYDDQIGIYDREESEIAGNIE